MTTGLADFFKYNLWANLRLLDACAHLSDAQLDATTRGTFGSVRETLIHIFAGEEGYVQRFTGKLPTPRLQELAPFAGFDETAATSEDVGGSTDRDRGAMEPSQVLHLAYQGQSYEVSAIFVLIQAVNHAVDHRSQVATQLGQQDVTPPELDGWAYYGVMH